MSSETPKRGHLLRALDRELRLASAQGVLLSQAVADRLGVNQSDLECLDLLHLHGPLTAGRLAELTGLTTGAITGLIDRLEAAGFARRERDPDDRRRVIVEPTPEAVDRIAPYYASMGRAMNDLLARYGDEELDLLVDFLGRANLVAREETAKLRRGAATERMGAASDDVAR